MRGESCPAPFPKREEGERGFFCVFLTRKTLVKKTLAGQTTDFWSLATQTWDGQVPGK
jgi:hypothetical protein